MNRVVKMTLHIFALALFLLQVAMAPLFSMDKDLARHLLGRTGFGGSPEEINSLAQLEYNAVVDQVLSTIQTEPRTTPPSWVHDTPPHPKQRKMMSEEGKKNFRMRQREHARELKKWWYQEMISTPSALTEKLTLFWHNHFTSEFKKVKWPPLMYRQNLLLRHHAAGNFCNFVHAIAQDPAMTLYLDNQRNQKGKPNENFARELLELFTLGEGNYTEADIKVG